MKLRVTTIVVNALMALFKLLMTYAQLGTPQLRVGALVHVLAAGALIVAAVMTWKRNWAGPLLAMVVMGWYIIKSLSLAPFVLGLKSFEMQLFVIIPFVVHVLVFVLNGVVFRVMKREGK